MIMHKHKGLYKGSSMRAHSIEQKHKDVGVQRWHNESLNSNQKKYMQGEKKSMLSKIPQKSKQLLDKLLKNSVEVVNVPIDEDGFMFVDLTNTQYKGIRIKFLRKEGNTKRTVGLEIEA